MKLIEQIAEMENSAEVKMKLNVQWKPRRFVPY